jgi:hypothetical protein
MSKYHSYLQVDPRDQRRARGIYDQVVTDCTKPLDSLARIFSKSPYVAIIQSENDINNSLYVSFPDIGEFRTEKINNLKQYIVSVSDNPSDYNKKQLFMHACDAGNELCNNILNEELRNLQNNYRGRDKIERQNYENNLRYIKDLKNQHSDEFTGNISNERANFVNLPGLTPMVSSRL